MAEFPNNTVHGTVDNYSGGLIVFAGRFQMPENGTATKIWIYTSQIDAGVTMGIYEDSSNSPGALLSVTAGGELDGPGSSEFKSQDITASLVEDAFYWLAVYCDPGGGGAQLSGIAYTTDSGKGKFVVEEYVDGDLPDPAPGGLTDLNQTFSIYVEYTASGGGETITVDKWGQRTNQPYPHKIFVTGY
jgi:hypothetical protein